jgi:Bacterial regulatory helix-turn-helix proteins, AraC family
LDSELNSGIRKLPCSGNSNNLWLANAVDITARTVGFMFVTFTRTLHALGSGFGNSSSAFDMLDFVKQLLQRPIAYIMENLGGYLTLAQMAAVAHLSPYHFARQFKAATGL